MTRLTAIPHLAAGLLALLPLDAAADTRAQAPSFLIVSAGGRGNQSLAQAFLADFGAALRASWPEDAGPAPSFEGRYHVTEGDALASVRSRKPAVAIVSPGFFEDHRAALDLRIAARPVRALEGEPVAHLVTKDGAQAAAAIAGGRIEGLRIGGPMVAEPEWARRRVLAPLGGEPQLVPLERALEAVRQVKDGRLDAALLHAADWQTLEEAGKDAGLVRAWTSRPLEEGPVVTFGAPDEASRRAVEAMERFGETPEGRKVLARMTLRAFVPARSEP